MRKILIAIGLFIFLAVAVATAPSACSTSKVAGTTELVNYYDDTLATVNGTTYCLAYGNGSDSEVSSDDGVFIIALHDNVPVDTTFIKGNFNGFQAEGAKLKILSGIDTLTYDFDELPKVLDIVIPTMLPGSTETNFKKTFALSDSSFDCDFSAQIHVLPDEGQWLYNCLNTMLHKIVFDIMSENPTIQVKWYSGDKNDLKAMAAHYQAEFERLYREDYDDPDDEGRCMGPKYDCWFQAMPIWESEDKSLVTYKFYNYQYMGGAHGGMNEYYFTFNRQTGKLLGVNDLFATGEFTRALAELEKKIREYKVGQGFADREWSAYVDDYLADNGLDYSLKESVAGQVYPRPALTKHGVVFSYQPYEMGSFSEGILHFVVPYSNVKLKVKL